MHLAALWALFAGGVVAVWKFLPSSLKDVLAEPLKNAWQGWLDSGKRERDIFMLKAMGYEESSTTIVGRPFTLSQIEHKLTMYQIEFVFGGKNHVEDELIMEERVRELEKWGLPSADEGDTAGQKKLEPVLMDMVHRGKLKFHPPDAYAVV